MRMLVLPSLAVLLLTSCESARFYAQAARGQWELMSRKQPVSRLLANPDLDGKLRRQLELTGEIRRFAADELHLPAHGQYDTYVDLGRKHVSWVVMAAPEFSVEPKRWWYPLLGKLEYRGYFAEKDATRMAKGLMADGFDVAAGGVDAYSTLGFLRDPLLNTFIFDPDVDLAELLFHELTHQKVFLPGDTDFNEAFATATAQEGVRRWLRAKGRLRDLAHYNHRVQEERTFVDEVLKTRAELERLYSVKDSMDHTALRREKAALFATLRRRILQMPELKDRREYAAWLSKPLNNARLNTISAYHTLVPAFHRLLAQHQGNLTAFFSEVKSMRLLSKKERRQRLGVEGAGH